MNKRQIHGGELFGVILLACIGLDLVVGLWMRSTILRIAPLWANGWIGGGSIIVGVVALALGCIGGGISHEAFNKAVDADGEVKYVLKDGLFSLVRHPFYASLMLISLAFVLILRSYLLLAGWAVITAILAGDAREEEKQLLEKFGQEYASYQQKTGMFFPKLFRR